MNLIRRSEAVQCLKQIKNETMADVKRTDAANLPVSETANLYTRGLACGVQMAADALATVEDVDLFAGPGILN